MLTEYFVEVPNTNIKESVSSLDDSWDICYNLAIEYGHAQVVWYALNGTRVVYGSYGDPKLVGIYN